MASKPKKRHALKKVSLREDLVRSSGPLTVDRDKGIIYGIKILGWDSDNDRHYLPEAGRKALALYEGAKAYANHPDKPTELRKLGEALGVWHNPKWKPDGVYADLHYFKTHPLAECICEDAERGLGAFGASHNADGQGEQVNGKFQVNRILEVRSIDIVTEAATTSNLWEGKKPITNKVKVRDVLEGLTVDRKVPLAIRKRLLEEMDKGCLKEEMELNEDDAPMMDEPPAEADPMETIKGGYMSACQPLLDKAMDGDDEALKALNDYVKHHRKLAGKQSTEEGDDEEEEVPEAEEKDKDVEEGSDELRGKNKKGQMRAIGHFSPDKGYDESRKPRPPAKGSRNLTEALCKRLCANAGIKENPALLEAMARTGSATDALSLLEAIKAQTGNGQQRNGQPRSSGPGFTVQEARTPKNSEEFLEAISSVR